MSNIKTNLQTQTSNALHNAIMEAGGKDRPPMLAPDQLNAEVEAVQIILTGIDNDIYSTIDACPNACEMWKAIERLKQGESINVQDLETNLYWEFEKFTSWDGESLKSYCLRGTGYDNQRAVNVAGARENVGTQVVQQSGIQCYNCKIYGHVAKECQKPKKAKDVAYHKEKMLLYNAKNSRPIIDVEPLQKIQNNDDNYNVFAIESEHPEQPESRTVDQDDNDDLAKERDLLASLIAKLKYEIDDSKNQTISIMSQQKEEQTKFYKTREEKELEKVIALENKIKSLDDIVYKTGQSVQTMNMLNRNCKTNFVKPEFLKKAQRSNPRLYDIGCYIDNLTLMLAPDSDETIRLA
ncbi:retrovirus-related pol polyprotein from transposon TNT 1-94 [Tanacetum coccineum]